MVKRHPSWHHRGSAIIVAVFVVLLGVTAEALPVAAQAATPPPPPTISAVKPAVARPGDVITISGRNFIDVKSVTMAGVSLKHKVNSRRKITATAPRSAARGPIMVSTRGGLIASPRIVVVQPTLKISPARSPAGSELGVAGRGFIPAEPVDIFYGRLAQASTTADHSGAIAASFVIPAKQEPGRSYVRVQGRFSGVPVDVPHEVSASWPQRGLGADGNRHQFVDIYLGATAAPSLVLDWVADTIGPSRSSPAVTDGAVYAGAGTGAVLTMPIDCATGGVSCSSQALGVTRGSVGSSPAVLGSTVFVGSEDGSLYAFDATCPLFAGPCDPVWSYATEGPITSSPVVDGDLVVVGSDDGRVYAFDAQCGSNEEPCAPRWVAETGGPVRSSPAIHDGVVYIGSDDGYVYAYETDCAQNGRSCGPLWRGFTGGVVRSSPAVSNGLVYVGSGDSKVHGFPTRCGDDGSACRAIWRGAADGPIESSPAVAEGLVVVGTMAGSVMAFPAACSDRTLGCAPTWTAVTGGPVRSSPAIGGVGIGGTMVFVGSDDGFLYGYPLKCRQTGKELTCKAVWASGTAAPISASPAIVDGAVYVSSEDGTVRRWSRP